MFTWQVSLALRKLGTVSAIPLMQSKTHPFHDFKIGVVEKCASFPKTANSSFDETNTKVICASVFVCFHKTWNNRVRRIVCDKDSRWSHPMTHIPPWLIYVPCQSCFQKDLFCSAKFQTWTSACRWKHFLLHQPFFHDAEQNFHFSSRCCIEFNSKFCAFYSHIEGDPYGSKLPLYVKKNLGFL